MQTKITNSFTIVNNLSIIDAIKHSKKSNANTPDNFHSDLLPTNTTESQINAINIVAIHPPTRTFA